MKRFLPLLLCCLCLLLAACTEEASTNTQTNILPGKQTESDLHVTDTEGILSSEPSDLPCSHVFGSWETVIAAEEGVAGLEKQVCTLCGEEETRETDPLPVHVHVYTETVYLPNCLEEGYTLKTCTCGEQQKTDVTKASGHIFADWTVEKAPSVEAEGLKSRTCNECGIKETDPVEKLPPPPVVHVHEYTETVYPPTCLTDGYIARSCTCGDYYTLTGDPSPGHRYGEQYVALEPGTYGGLARRDCLECGEVEMTTIPALPVAPDVNDTPDGESTDTEDGGFGSLSSDSGNGDGDSDTEDTGTPEDHPTGNITYYNQRDVRWGDLQLGCGNMKNNGCGPTSIAMVLSYFGTDVTPPEVATWLYENTIEFNRAFHGISATGLRLGLEHWNRTAVPIHTYEDMIAHLEQGAIIIGAQGKGAFVTHAESSHCIVIFGLTEEGKVSCYDSYTERLSGSYSAQRIWKERSTLPVDLRKEGVSHFAVY